MIKLLQNLVIGIIVQMYLYRFCIACIIIIALTILRQIHIIQLNSYNLDQQLVWYKKNSTSFAINIVLLIVALIYYELKIILLYYLIIISIFALLIENLPRKQKKKLVFTARIKRLIFLCVILFIPFIIPTFIYKNEFGLKFSIYALALAPLIIFIAYLILLPFENGLRKKFMNEAKQIIQSNADLYVIGITGSFGKTSVKYYLSRLLKLKYSVCMTPESYNTAMGATLTIKNDLKNINDIFVCEMGARRVGDISEICNVVIPNGAILTDIGNMHLDTFKNIDNVAKTKFELVDSAYNNIYEGKLDINRGIILLNGDNDLIREKASKYLNKDKILYFYGLDNKNDFYATNIIGSDRGISFVIKRKDDKNFNLQIETRLLGKYNVMDLLAAVSYSLLLKIDERDIRNEVRLIESVPHRLQLLDGDKNNLIIDDAYNSNPSGARNACDVLSTFNGYTKIIITPGMVELYDKQDIENESFAEYAGKNVDYAIIVGHTNKLALDKGFKNSMDGTKIYYYDRVEDAINFARTGIRGKKVILLENDLSDNY